MNFQYYRPTSRGDFTILLDRFFDDMIALDPREEDPHYNKAEHLREMFIEVFDMGYKCGQLEVNRPIDYDRICKNAYTD